MNNPSLEAFEPRLERNGLLLLSSSLVNRPTTRGDVKIVSVPASEIATSAGTERAANMAMLGAYVALTGVVAKESIVKGLKELFGKKIDLFETNVRAFEEGMKFAETQSPKRVG
jgi:2-oxoglutarate ferredoxin oxidoreductase subunit gamma